MCKRGYQMKRKTILPVSLFSLALLTLPVVNSHAHPNHMSFENVEHEAQINQTDQVIKTDVLLHDTQEQPAKTSSIRPAPVRKSKGLNTPARTIRQAGYLAGQLASAISK